LRNNPIGLAASLRGLGTGAQPEYWSRLSDLKLPTLIITGSLDQKFSDIGLQMASRIPQARLQNVPDAGHTVHLEQPAVYKQLITDFINS
jgi:2-succinyl-6-hydroxy-2,4-cyclohexadiene-1-carboxylate synthase